VKTADQARRVAVLALAEITGARRMMSDVLADPALGLASLGPAERARAQRLVALALRRILPADTVLGPHLQREPSSEVRAVLRLAVAELAERPDQAHGIVDSAVTLVRGLPGQVAAAGFVNAVLRRVTAAPLALEVQKLPGWLRRQLAQAWGKDTIDQIEAAHLAGGTLDLTLRSPDTAAHWAQTLGAEVLPTGGLRLPNGAQVSALPGYASGDWWVQDAAAALPARVLAPAPGERVLDLCAAPGGKTMQLAAMGAQVTALDQSAARLGRLSANLARTGLTAEVVVADALDWSPDQPFDAILLDAPCSATGTIRRHPDLPFVKTRADVEALVAVQARLIDRALGFLKPGGRLVYCTCSILPAEGEDQITAALLRHPGLAPDPEATAGFGDDWQSAPGQLRILPHHWDARGGLDGFFIAALRHTGR